MKIESGEKVIHQSHKNRLDLESINTFLCMACQNNICQLKEKETDYVPQKIENTYLIGMNRLHQEYTSSSCGLNWFKPQLSSLLLLSQED
jgi:hypothetical protein